MVIVVCGVAGVRLHVDHIRPLSQGGSNSPWNLRTLCEDCHLSRHPFMQPYTYTSEPAPTLASATVGFLGVVAVLVGFFLVLGGIGLSAFVTLSRQGPSLIIAAALLLVLGSASIIGGIFAFMKRKAFRH